jgi:hypothetical protein
VVEGKKPDKKHESAAELLGDWRAAERDTVAAKTAASVATLAVAAALAADEAVLEAESAARAAMDAATRAKSAAEHAKNAASHASEAAQIASTTAEGDKARADQADGAPQVRWDSPCGPCRARAIASPLLLRFSASRHSRQCR